MRHYAMAMLLVIFGAYSGISQSSDDLGIASYYSDDFQGHKTASGEKYDKNGLTAAHKELPIGTIIRVTRLDNRKSVKVRVNDRGPYIKGRIVEVSKKAAERLDLINDGIAKVRVEVLRNVSSVEETSVATTNSTPPPPPASKPKVVEEPKVNKRPQPTAMEEKSKNSERLTVKEAPVEKKAAVKESPKLVEGTPKAGPSKGAAMTDGALEGNLVTAKDYRPQGLYKIEISKPKSYGFGVQVAAVSNHASMMQQVAELQGKWFKNILVNIEESANGKTYYKIILGSFKDRTTANNYKNRLKAKKNINGFVVDLSDLDKDG
ncbi:MAG: septal ring lytic transglycosylase RlpA family protein [Bacteroidota bacterium]